MLTRRAMLAASAGGVAALAATPVLAACTDQPPPLPTVPRPTNGPPLDPSSWSSVRAQFVLDSGAAQFTAFILASHPVGVHAAIETYRAGLDADTHGYLDDFEARLDQAAVNAAARYLATSPGQIALTDSTTMGLGLVYTGLHLAPGHEVLTTEHDFYSTHESLRLRAARDGVIVRRVRLYDEPEHADAAQITSRLLAAIGARTRAVALTWVHSSTGVKLPIRAIADGLAALNQNRAEADRVLLCVDAVHGFGVEGTTVDNLGCDVLVSGCHKWLFGPRGTGLIWARPAAWSRVTPVIPSFALESIIGWIEGVPPRIAPGPAATPGGYHSFEHRWALTEAFALHQAIGPDRVAQRSHELAAALKQGLARISKIRLRTPMSAELSAGLVCCEVAGVPAQTAVSRLRAAKVYASVTPYATSYLRFGTSIVTNESDVESALRAVRSL